MKINYKSVTGSYSIEFEDSWNEIGVLEYNGEEFQLDEMASWQELNGEFDRVDLNGDKAETRCHRSYEACDPNGELFASKENIQDDYERKTDDEKLHLAVSKLKPKQAALINEIYFSGVDPTKIAKREGNTSVYNRLKRAYANLKKILEQQNRE